MGPFSPKITTVTGVLGPPPVVTIARWRERKIHHFQLEILEVDRRKQEKNALKYLLIRVSCWVRDSRSLVYNKLVDNNLFTGLTTYTGPYLYIYI